jgi:hypothetical protein
MLIHPLKVVLIMNANVNLLLQPGIYHEVLGSGKYRYIEEN